MAHKTGRWMLNTATGTLHDLDNLDERCNTDQVLLKDRRRANSQAAIRSDARFRTTCRWCVKGGAKVVPNPDAEDTEPTPEEEAENANPLG